MGAEREEGRHERVSLLPALALLRAMLLAIVVQPRAFDTPPMQFDSAAPHTTNENNQHVSIAEHNHIFYSQPAYSPVFLC